MSMQLGEILHIQKGKKPQSQSTEALDGYLPYVDIKAFEKGIIDNYASTEKSLLCDDGDLLIVCDGSRSGLTGRAIKGVVGSTLAKIYADGLTTEYLRYFIQSKYTLLNTQKKGTGTPHLNAEILKLSIITVPSLPEQDRIVTRIEELFSELDKAVETLQTTKKQLAVYRQAVLKEAFSGNLTQNKKIIVNLSWLDDDKTKELPQIPPEWRYIPLANLGDLERGKSKHRPRNDPKLFENGKYPFIQTGEVKAATKFITKYSKMYGDFGLNQSKQWKKGTLCITIAANIAETAFLGIDACFPDSIVGFTPCEHIIPEYVRYFIESQKRRLWAFAPATAQKNINLDTLENLIVPYCSIEEQKNVISEINLRMTICESIEKEVDTVLSQAEAMRQSILKKAFEGGLS